VQYWELINVNEEPGSMNGGNQNISETDREQPTESKSISQRRDKECDHEDEQKHSITERGTRLGRHRNTRVTEHNMGRIGHQVGGREREVRSNGT